MKACEQDRRTERARGEREGRGRRRERDLLWRRARGLEADRAAPERSELQALAGLTGPFAAQGARVAARLERLRQDTAPLPVRRALGALQSLLDACPTGAPLPESVKALVRQVAGVPAPEVRLHTGATAARIADALGAHALTVGRDVFFGSGRFDVESRRGLSLLAHETAHAIQAGGAPAPAGAALVLGARGAGQETAAAELGERVVARRFDRVVGGRPAPVLGHSAPHVVRREGPGTSVEAGGEEVAAGGPEYEGGAFDGDDPEFKRLLARMYDPDLAPEERRALGQEVLRFAEQTRNPAMAFILLEGVHYTGLDKHMTVDGSELQRNIGGSNYATRYAGTQTWKDALRKGLEGDASGFGETGIVCNQAAWYLTRLAYPAETSGRASRESGINKLAGNRTNWRWLQSEGMLTEDLTVASQGDMLLNWNGTKPVSTDEYEREMKASGPDAELVAAHEALKALPTTLAALLPAIHGKSDQLARFETEAAGLVAQPEAAKEALGDVPRSVRALMVKAAPAWDKLGSEAREGFRKLVGLPADRYALAKKKPAAAKLPWAGLEAIWIHEPGHMGGGTPVQVNGAGHYDDNKPSLKGANHIEIVFDHRPGPGEGPVSELALVGSRTTAKPNGVKRDGRGKIEWAKVQELMDPANNKVFMLGRTAGIGGKRQYIQWPEELLKGSVKYKREEAVQKEEMTFKVKDEAFQVPGSEEARGLVGALPETRKVGKATHPAVAYGELEASYPRLIELVNAFTGITSSPGASALKKVVSLGGGTVEREGDAGGDASGQPFPEWFRASLDVLADKKYPEGMPAALRRQHGRTLQQAAKAYKALGDAAQVEVDAAFAEPEALSRPLSFVVTGDEAETTHTVTKRHNTWTVTKVSGGLERFAAAEAPGPEVKVEAERGPEPAAAKDSGASAVAPAERLKALLGAPAASTEEAEAQAVAIAELISGSSDVAALERAYEAVSGESLEQGIARKFDPASAPSGTLSEAFEHFAAQLTAVLGNARAASGEGQKGGDGAATDRAPRDGAATPDGGADASREGRAGPGTRSKDSGADEAVATGRQMREKLRTDFSGTLGDMASVYEAISRVVEISEGGAKGQRSELGTTAGIFASWGKGQLLVYLLVGKLIELMKAGRKLGLPKEMTTAAVEEMHGRGLKTMGWYTIVASGSSDNRHKVGLSGTQIAEIHAKAKASPPSEYARWLTSNLGAAFKTDTGLEVAWLERMGLSHRLQTAAHVPAWKARVAEHEAALDELSTAYEGAIATSVTSLHGEFTRRFEAVEAELKTARELGRDLGPEQASKWQERLEGSSPKWSPARMAKANRRRLRAWAAHVATRELRETHEDVYPALGKLARPLKSGPETGNAKALIPAARSSAALYERLGAEALARYGIGRDELERLERRKLRAGGYWDGSRRLNMAWKAATREIVAENEDLTTLLKSAEGINALDESAVTYYFIRSGAENYDFVKNNSNKSAENTTAWYTRGAAAHPMWQAFYARIEGIDLVATEARNISNYKAAAPVISSTVSDFASLSRERQGLLIGMLVKARHASLRGFDERKAGLARKKPTGEEAIAVLTGNGAAARFKVVWDKHKRKPEIAKLLEG